MRRARRVVANSIMRGLIDFCVCCIVGNRRKYFSQNTSRAKVRAYVRVSEAADELLQLGEQEEVVNLRVPW